MGSKHLGEEPGQETAPKQHLQLSAHSFPSSDLSHLIFVLRLVEKNAPDSASTPSVPHFLFQTEAVKV